MTVINAGGNGRLLGPLGGATLASAVALAAVAYLYGWRFSDLAYVTRKVRWPAEYLSGADDW